LLRVGRLALVGGPLGIALITLLTIGVGWFLAGSYAECSRGAALSVASTMVLMKFLLERGDLAAPHGEAVVGSRWSRISLWS